MQRPSFGKGYILNEFDRLSSKISIPVRLFIIGGMGLIHFGLKEATKDIDIVVQSLQELDALVDSLQDLGYRNPSSVEITRPYKDMEASNILENTEGFRWDIFCSQVCGALTFSNEMMSRATNYYSKRLMKAFLASKEDIFLFKAITEREADLDDMRLLAESGLDWKVIEEECRKQSVSSGRLWENALLQNLIDLRYKHKIRTPIERSLQKIVEEKLIEYSLTQAVREGHFTVKMISQTTELPEHLIRESAKKMERKGLLRIDRSSRPYKFALTPS